MKIKQFWLKIEMLHGKEQRIKVEKFLIFEFMNGE